MKDPEHHSITKAIKLLRIWLTRKKRLMVQAQDLQRQLAEAWRDKDQLEADVEETTLKLKNAQQANNNYAYVIDKLKAEIKRLDKAFDFSAVKVAEARADNDALRGAIKTHALRFNDAPLANCYYCIFCNEKLPSIGPLEHKDDCVVLLTRGDNAISKT